MKHCSHIFFILVLFFMTHITTACTDEPNGTQNNQTQNNTTQNNTTQNNQNQNNTNMNTNCQARCVSMASMCGAPMNQASLICSKDFCVGNQTESYVACLEKVPCNVVAEPETLRAMCGFQDTNNMNTGKDCSGYPRCDGNSVQTCSVVAGAEAIETSACGANQTCSKGKCEQNACIASKKTGCSPQNNPSNCCDDRQVCFSNGNARGETICCIRPNDACTKDEDCCGSDGADNRHRCIKNKCTLTL